MSLDCDTDSEVRKVYVESSVLGVALHPGMSSRRRNALSLLRRIRDEELDGYTSSVAVAEMRRVSAESFLRLQRLASQTKLGILDANDESDALAQAYLFAGIIPENYRDDARHIAVAVVYEIPIIASYNHRYIVRAEVMTGVNGVNLEHGYPPIVICTPEALV